MNVRKMILVIVTTLVLFFSNGNQNALFAQGELPDTGPAKCLEQLLAAVNLQDESIRNEFLKDGFAKNDEQTLKNRIGQTNQLKSMMGELTFKELVESTDSKIIALVSTTSGTDLRLTLSVDSDSPDKITSIGVAPAENSATATTEPFDATARSAAVKRIAELLRSNYVFPEVGEKMAAAIETSSQAGDYDKLESADDFARNLTDQLREICSDKHLSVRAGGPRQPGSRAGRRSVDNHGFVKAEVLTGGIGYLKFNYFSGADDAKETASAAMNFLGNSRALVFDLRENGGGSPDMIIHLTSYLFDEPTHLNSFYNRIEDATSESWTTREVDGKKFSPDTPVFVLTSNFTFSGAEEFSYNLKNLKRGTIVGETTGGGAHPVMGLPVGKHLTFRIPFARAINPITNTNWEGVGVKPDVEVSSDEALEKAIELAREAVASEEKTATKPSPAESPDLEQLEREAESLMNGESFSEAAKILGKLSELDSGNGEVWFRYGYCLHMSGEIEKAIPIHQKAAGFDEFAVLSNYNLACAYSLQKNADASFEALHKAIELGYRNAAQLENDPDFDNVKNDERFEKVLEKIDR